MIAHHRFICLISIATFAAVQSISVAKAESSVPSGAEHRPMLRNQGEMLAERNPKDVVFTVSWGTARFPKGSNVIGVYRENGGVISVCITRAFFPDGRRQTAPGDQCLALATPMPSAKIERLPSVFSGCPKRSPSICWINPILDSLPQRMAWG